MNRILKIIILISLLSPMACSGGTGGGDFGLGLGAGGGLAGDGATDGDAKNQKPDDPNAFEIGETIDIPVPIAKGIETPDATRVSGGFDRAGNQSSVQKSYLTHSFFIPTAYAYAAEYAGSLFIQGHEDSVPPFATLQFSNKQGEVLGSIEASQKGEWKKYFDLSEVNFGEPVAVYIFEEDQQQAGAPIIVTNFESVFPFETHPFTVQITNQNLIENKALSVREVVLYSALDMSHTPHLASIPVQGGWFNNFATLNQSAKQIELAPDSTFAVYKNYAGMIYRVESQGNSISISDQAIKGPIDLSPNGSYVVSTLLNGEIIIEPVSGAEGTLQSDAIILGITSGDQYDECSWSNDENIICLGHHENVHEVIYTVDRFSLEFIDLEVSRGQTVYEPPNNIVSTFLEEVNCKRLRNLNMRPGSDHEFIFECVRDSNRVDLFGIEMTEREPKINLMVGESFHHDFLSESHYLPDGSVTFDATMSREGISVSVIGLYDGAKKRPFVLTHGFKPAVVDSKIIVHLSEDHRGGFQVSVINRDFFLLTD